MNNTNQVEITIGDIIPQPRMRTVNKRYKTQKTPVLDITIEFAYGFAKKLDFVYLAPANSRKIPTSMNQLQRDMIFKLERSNFVNSAGRILKI